jgi:hypothetical protein
MGRGVECSEIMVFDERDGGTFFNFSDPDGNTWSVQELTELPAFLTARGRITAYNGPR